MKVPSLPELVLLALAAYRLWKLVGDDTITDPVRDRVSRGREMIECPWCLGSWVAAGWWVAWQLWPHGTLVAAGAFAVAAFAGVLADVVFRLADHD